MSSYAKQHLVWGGLLLVILCVALFSMKKSVTVVYGFPNSSAGAGIVSARGGIGIIGFLGSGGNNFKLYVESYSDPLPEYWPQFIYWFQTVEGMLYIPLWVVALIPITFWVFALRKIKRATRESKNQ